MSKNKKIILGIFLGIAVLYGGYSFWGSGSDAPQSDTGLSSETVGDHSEVGKSLIMTLETIRAIKLDKSFLDGPIFASLEDFSTEITPQPVGRDNPFAPTGTLSAPKSQPKH